MNESTRPAELLGQLGSEKPAPAEHGKPAGAMEAEGASTVASGQLEPGSANDQSQPPVVYDGGQAKWWMTDYRGEYVYSSEGGVRRFLRQSGFSSDTPAGQLDSPMNGELLRLQRAAPVEYAGPVAGHSSGVIEMGSRQILVTKSCRVLQSVPGDWGQLEAVLRQMFGSGDQWDRFILWAHFARKRLLTRSWTPFPALGLIGPPGSGKSLLQGLITLALGGRSAKPAQFMQGQTNFNGDLFSGEHLVFEDESARADHGARRSFGEKIKELLFCKGVQCHGKNRPGIVLEPIWALSMSLNDEPEHLEVLPQIDESLADKILLLKIEKHPREVPAGETETEWLTSVLLKEAPAFAAYLDSIDVGQYPQSLLHPRTGVAGWQHPEILNAITSRSPEAKLLSLVDEVIFPESDPLPWTGTAEDLSRRLRESAYRAEVNAILRHSNSCGTYLGRLERSSNGRVASARTAESRRWKIHPPT